MKTTLFLTAFLTGAAGLLIAQTKFIDKDYERYFDWHNQQAQIDQLYTPGAQLYVFGESAKIYRYPDQQSEVLARLQDGQPVWNRSDYRRVYEIPQGEINGYRDTWFKVVTADGLSGYVFGTQLAKGWRKVDLTGDGQSELLMLGVSPTPRRAFGDIRAELRIVQNGHLLYNTTINGLCVFEECDSSPLLRVIRDQPYRGGIVIEASTMTVGCLTGIERAFFYWNGHQLESVFHAEYTMDREYERQTFTVQDPQAVRTMMCSYKEQDQAFNPVWECREIQTKNPAPPQATKAAARARAR